MIKGGTVEDLLKTVLDDENAKIFRKTDEQLTIKGQKAINHLSKILLELARYVDYSDSNKGIVLRLDQAEDLIDDMYHIIERGC